MPYILVEMMNPIGGRELLAAPANWIESRTEGSQGYLSWPYARSIRKLNELFEDEHSIPSEVWPKHECEILCRNIPSLSSADKMIETMEISQQETKVARAMAAKRNEPPPLHPLPSVSASRTVSGAGGVRKLLSSLISPRDDDPLGDVKPCPPMLDLMYELKRLIQANQEEMRQKLKEGFNKVEKSVEKMNDKYLESNAKQYEQGRADACAFQQEGQPDRFQVKCMTEMSEVDEFEKRLEDEEYRAKVCQWIDASVGHLRVSEYRMHTFLDLIYDRKLFSLFSWTGAGNRKRALCLLKNSLSLFEYAGTTSEVRPDKRAVEVFMRKKLHNSITRIKVKGVRRSVPHSGRVVRKRKYREGESVTIIPKSLIVTSTTDTVNPPAVRSREVQSQAKPSTSGALRVVRVPADPLSSEGVVMKQDPIAIEGLNDLEELFHFRQLQK